MAEFPDEEGPVAGIDQRLSRGSRQEARENCRQGGGIFGNDTMTIVEVNVGGKVMALHPNFPNDPHAILDPAIRWFPADEACGKTRRSTDAAPWFRPCARR